MVVGGINMKGGKKPKECSLCAFLTESFYSLIRLYGCHLVGKKNPAHIQPAPMASPGLTFHIYRALLAKRGV